jgi:hypothetical protein
MELESVATITELIGGHRLGTGMTSETGCSFKEIDNVTENRSSMADVIFD